MQLTRQAVEQIRDGARATVEAALKTVVERWPEVPDKPGVDAAYDEVQADANAMGVLVALADDWLQMDSDRIVYDGLMEHLFDFHGCNCERPDRVA